MSVFKKIAAVQAALAKQGISKDQTNSFDKYKFRGIDDVYNSLAPIMAEHKLVVIPNVESYTTETFQTSAGKPSIMVRATVRYVLVDAEDDSSTSALVVGEASDRGDKAMNKALSAAYKLMAFQVFCIPTEAESRDSEEESIEHTVKLMGAAEIASLRGWLSKTNTDEAAFCEWQKVKSLETMQLERYAPALAALQRKEQRLSEEYAKQEAMTAESLGNGQ